MPFGIVCSPPPAPDYQFTNLPIYYSSYPRHANWYTAIGILYIYMVMANALASFPDSDCRLTGVEVMLMRLMVDGSLFIYCFTSNTI